MHLAQWSQTEGTQFWVGCDTNKLIANKNKVLSPVETETEKHIHIYLCEFTYIYSSERVSVHFKGPEKGNATSHQNKPDPRNMELNKHSRKRSPPTFLPTVIKQGLVLLIKK